MGIRSRKEASEIDFLGRKGAGPWVGKKFHAIDNSRTRSN